MCLFAHPCLTYPFFFAGIAAPGVAKKVDLDAVPQIAGQSLFEIELDPEKPWKMPGQSMIKCIFPFASLESLT